MVCYRIDLESASVAETIGQALIAPINTKRRSSTRNDGRASRSMN